jgi:hypothetical protein
VVGSSTNADIGSPAIIGLRLRNLARPMGLQTVFAITQSDRFMAQDGSRAIRGFGNAYVRTWCVDGVVINP